MLKINQFTGLQRKTGPETAGPLNRAIIQCLHITAPAHKFRYRCRKFSLHYSTLQSKETSAVARWHSALSRPTVRTRSFLSRLTGQNEWAVLTTLVVMTYTPGLPRGFVSILILSSVDQLWQLADATISISQMTVTSSA